MFNQVRPKIIQTNRLPFLIGIVVLLLVLSMFMCNSQKNHKVEIIQNKPRQSVVISSKTEETSWFNDERFKNMKMTRDSLHHPTAQENENQVISSQAEDLKKQVIEDEYAAQLEIQKIDDKNKIEEKKLEVEAMTSPLNIDIPAVPGTLATIKPSPSNKDALTDGLNEMTNLVKRATTGEKGSTLAGLGSQLIADLNNQGEKYSFLQNSQRDDDYLGSDKKKPRSVYEVKEGTFIPAALITGINSDLPGSVDAQVITNVYDSVTGNYLLIPQGSKLIGEYNSSLTFGQMRVQVVWNRIIFPDGKSIDLKKMQGVDLAGYTGFHDKVDSHYLRIYGNAVLLSLMGAGYDILNQHAQQPQQYGDPRDVVAANVGQRLSDVAQQALEKNMDVQPTLIIDPGYKFKIMVMKDMVLENIEDVEGALAYSK